MIPQRIINDKRFDKITDDQWKVAAMIAKHALNYLSEDVEKLTGVKKNTYIAWYYKNQNKYKELLKELAKAKYGSHELEVFENVANRAKTDKCGFARLYMETTGHLEPAQKQELNIQFNIVTGIPGSVVSQEVKQCLENTEDSVEVSEDEERESHVN